MFEEQMETVGMSETFNLTLVFCRSPFLLTVLAGYILQEPEESFAYTNNLRWEYLRTYFLFCFVSVNQKGKMSRVSCASAHAF